VGLGEISDKDVRLHEHVGSPRDVRGREEDLTQMLALQVLCQRCRQPLYDKLMPQARRRCHQ
jgi:hypothetical protein